MDKNSIREQLDFEGVYVQDHYLLKQQVKKCSQIANSVNNKPPKIPKLIYPILGGKTEKTY